MRTGASGVSIGVTPKGDTNEGAAVIKVTPLSDDARFVIENCTVDFAHSVSLDLTEMKSH